MRKGRCGWRRQPGRGSQLAQPKTGMENSLQKLVVLVTQRCLAQGNKHARLDGDEHLAVVEEFCMIHSRKLIKKLAMSPTCLPEP